MGFEEGDLVFSEFWVNMGSIGLAVACDWENGVCMVQDVEVEWEGTCLGMSCNLRGGSDEEGGVGRIGT